MNQLDVYYRALLKYCELTSTNSDCVRLSSAFANSNIDTDNITVTRAYCTVDEDWITAIEEGLIHIEKAIKQERQFIYSNGEVIPIEKVKHVSRDSVRHLAKHSELITEYDEGEDIVPDKLYTVERLNDYTVYENRFLYMLLCYLRDFVTLRYNNILDETNKYKGKLTMKKEIVISKRKINYSVELTEECKDDRYLTEHNAAKQTIDRIDLILKTVLAFLSTPLMESASKVAMLKPPITKTNVLKMDNSFKGAVALYDFIISYDKPGYTITKETKEMSPFREDLSREIAEAGIMLSFLTYEYGLGIKSDLKDRYEREEALRKTEALRQKTEQLEALGRRIKQSGEDPEEYMLELEKHIRALKNENLVIDSIRVEIENCRTKEQTLKLEIKDLTNSIDTLKEEKLLAEQQHIAEIDALNQAHDTNIKEINSLHESETAQLKSKYNLDIAALKNHISEKDIKHKEELSEKSRELLEVNEKLAELERRYEELKEHDRLSEAMLKGLRAERNLMTDNDVYTDKESFDELEREYDAFTRFFKSQWKKSKKNIRKEMLTVKNFKNKDENGSEP